MSHSGHGDMPTLTLQELVREVERDGGRGLYLRWSRGPKSDGVGTMRHRSRDALTGVPLPGLSASPLLIEPWWAGRSVTVWVARRVSDYQHLHRGQRSRPWLLEGQEVGRGPDNEPLVNCVKAIGWISEDSVAECERIINRAGGSDDWGPLDRGSS
jgi:hypothetical protein